MESGNSGDFIARFFQPSDVTKLTYNIAFRGGVVHMNVAITLTGISAGELFHVAIAWDRAGIDGGSDTGRGYLNGVQVASTTTAIASFTFPASYEFDIGNTFLCSGSNGR